MIQGRCEVKAPRPILGDASNLKARRSGIDSNDGCRGCCDRAASGDRQRRKPCPLSLDSAACCIDRRNCRLGAHQCRVEVIAPLSVAIENPQARANGVAFVDDDLSCGLIRCWINDNNAIVVNEARMQWQLLSPRPQQRTAFSMCSFFSQSIASHALREIPAYEHRYRGHRSHARPGRDYFASVLPAALPRANKCARNSQGSLSGSFRRKPLAAFNRVCALEIEVVSSFDYRQRMHGSCESPVGHYVRRVPTSRLVANGRVFLLIVPAGWINILLLLPSPHEQGTIDGNRRFRVG